MRSAAAAARRVAAAGYVSSANLELERCRDVVLTCLPSSRAVAARWAAGLQHGLPKFTGLSTFFRAPFSPTLEGATREINSPVPV